MLCRGKKTIKTSDQSSKNHDQFHEAEVKLKHASKEHVNIENVLETSNDNVPISRRKSGVIGSCNICRNSQSTEVIEVNTRSSLSNSSIAETVSKVSGDNTQGDLQNEVFPLPVYSVDHEKTKSPSIKGRSGAGMTPTKKSKSETTSMTQNAAMENIKAELGNRRKPKQKKIRKKSLNTEEDIQLVYKNQIASLNTAVAETSAMNVPTLSSQPTVEEESDLLENAEQERRRNKERVRAKHMMENKHLSSAKAMNKLDIAYLNAQKEIDKVLKPQSSELNSQHRNTFRKRNNNVGINGEDNEAYTSDDEKDSLEKARENMHKLLDDAFSVISQRKSNINKVQPDREISNKVQPARERSNEANSFNSQKNHLTRIEQIVQTDESMLSEKLHTPMQIHHSFAFNDPDGLVTWNPYRAYDDTTLISLNNAETNMSTAPVQQEKVKTSIFEQTFRPQSKYYATGPGEPIIIKTRNLEQGIPQNSTQRKISTTQYSHQYGINENLPSNIKSRHQETDQNPVFSRPIPHRSEVVHANNFYELSCFQETPTTSRLVKIETMDNTQPDSCSSPREDGGRTAALLHTSYTARHVEPSKSVDKNHDIVDVIKESLQPGASSQPLIDSLRKELQLLSSKGQTATKKADQEKTTSHSSDFRKQ